VCSPLLSMRVHKRNKLISFLILYFSLDFDLNRQEIANRWKIIKTECFVKTSFGNAVRELANLTSLKYSTEYSTEQTEKTVTTRKENVQTKIPEVCQTKKSAGSKI